MGSKKKRTSAAAPGWVSRLIKELRSRSNMTQAKLAQELDVSLPTVNRWEAGKTEPDPRAAKAIEEYLRRLGGAYADLHERYFPAAASQVPVEEPDEPEAGADRPEEEESPPQPAREASDTKWMETLLWKAACSIRGEKDAPKFKDYILPLVFIKRLSDVFDDEWTRLRKLYGDDTQTRGVLEADHSLVRFYLPPEARWAVLSGRSKFAWPHDRSPRTLGEQVNFTLTAIAKQNPILQGVIDTVDFNEIRNGEREVSDPAIKKIIELLSGPEARLGLHNVEPDFLGRAYEYLLRKFAEGQGQSAGEFFTPTGVGWLMARLMNPKPGEEAYDPCCGSGGLLIKCQLVLKEKDPEVAKPLRLYGQEWMGTSFAIARMNMIIHDMEGEIVRGDTMMNPKHLDHSKPKRFDLVVTNPMWNQKNFEPATYDNDPFERFTGKGGFAPAQSADWGWLQHVHASLSDAGRAAVVLDTGAASRGSGNEGDNRERTIRKWFVDQDLIEAVILLPDNLFYNTTAAGLIIVLNNRKPKDRKQKILLINASAEFQKGRPKNFLTDEGIQKIASIFANGTEQPRLSTFVTKKAIQDDHDYNLSPSRFIESGEKTKHRDIQEILNDLHKIDQEAKASDDKLKDIFAGLGYKWGGK